METWSNDEQSLTKIWIKSNRELNYARLFRNMQIILSDPLLVQNRSKSFQFNVAGSVFDRKKHTKSPKKRPINKTQRKQDRLYGTHKEIRCTPKRKDVRSYTMNCFKQIGTFFFSSSDESSRLSGNYYRVPIPGRNVSVISSVLAYFRPSVTQNIFHHKINWNTFSTMKTIKSY